VEAQGRAALQFIAQDCVVKQKDATKGVDVDETQRTSCHWTCKLGELAVFSQLSAKQDQPIAKPQHGCGQISARSFAQGPFWLTGF
jgi:hypothetical protein